MQHERQDIQILIDNTYLDEVNKYKYLGYSLDSFIKFNHQFKETTNKLNHIIRVFRRVRPTLATHATVTIFKTKFLPYIHYTALISHLMSKKHNKKLQVLQNNIIKTVYQLSNHTNTDLHHCNLNILPLENPNITFSWSSCTEGQEKLIFLLWILMRLIQA